MARIRPGSGSPTRWRSFVLPCALLCAWGAGVGAGVAFADPSVPLSDAPVVWFSDDTRPVPVPAFEEPGLIPYGYQSFVARPFSRFWHPGRMWRWIATRDNVQEAADLNTLDEVVDSTWFTNRIGLRPLNPRELAEGSGLTGGLASGPDRSAPWVVIGAKTSGVTPGFRIKDARGDVWLLKFDPPEHPGMTIRAGVVTNLFFHAMGFHVPVDRLVRFTRDDLVLLEGVTMRLNRGGKVTMTPANLDSVLTATRSIFNGEFHALASRYLDGVPLGPFDDQGRRSGDANDTVRHENRRELRALQVFGAWVNHFDTKAHNSLDMYVGEPGRGHVRHYLIDFASTLGAYGAEPVARYGNEFGLDVFPILGRTLTLGLMNDAWADARRPAGLSEIGLFDAESFQSHKWKPDLPNSQMANLTRLDGYWAAKIVSAFTEENIRIIVEQGDYQDPRSVDYLVDTLLARQKTLVQYWFDRVPPLDYFRPTETGVEFLDLAIERGFQLVSGTKYRYRVGAVDSGRRSAGWTQWRETSEPIILLEAGIGGDWRDVYSGISGDPREQPFLAMECQLNRGQGWSRSTTIYRAYTSGAIVALDR